MISREGEARVIHERAVVTPRNDGPMWHAKIQTAGSENCVANGNQNASLAYMVVLKAIVTSWRNTAMKQNDDPPQP